MLRSLALRRRMRRSFLLTLMRILVSLFLVLIYTYYIPLSEKVKDNFSRIENPDNGKCDKPYPRIGIWLKNNLFFLDFGNRDCHFNRLPHYDYGEPVCAPCGRRPPRGLAENGKGGGNFTGNIRLRSCQGPSQKKLARKIIFPLDKPAKCGIIYVDVGIVPTTQNHS